MTSISGADATADEPSPGPWVTGYRLEISGDFDRAGAEALMLEIERIGRRHGLILNSRVERPSAPRTGRSE